MKKLIIILLTIYFISISVCVIAETLPSQQAEMFPDNFFIRGDTSQKEIALTFDDGPDMKNTPKILDILKEKEIKATFFLLGKNIKKHPEITQRISQEGHQLANHSWSHKNFSYLKDDYILKEEIKPTSEIIEKLTGEYPKVLRPPYGIINNSTIQMLKEKDWIIVNWSIDSNDWQLSQKQIINIIKANHHYGGVILMHSREDNKNTVESLPEIIRILKGKEYNFVTVNQLI